MLNYEVMKKLEDFHVVYVVREKKNCRKELYKFCPFKVIYDSLMFQPNNNI